MDNHTLPSNRPPKTKNREESPREEHERLARHLQSNLGGYIDSSVHAILPDKFCDYPRAYEVCGEFFHAAGFAPRSQFGSAFYFEKPNEGRLVELMICSCGSFPNGALAFDIFKYTPVPSEPTTASSVQSETQVIGSRGGGSFDIMPDEPNRPYDRPDGH